MPENPRYRSFLRPGEGPIRETSVIVESLRICLPWRVTPAVLRLDSTSVHRGATCCDEVLRPNARLTSPRKAGRSAR